MEELKFFTVCKTIVRKGFSVMCWSESFMWETYSF